MMNNNKFRVYQSIMLTHIIYQTDTRLWLIEKDNFARFCYEKEITPIRLLLLECTTKYIELLREAFNEDKQVYKEFLLEELNTDFTTCYQN